MENRKCEAVRLQCSERGEDVPAVRMALEKTLSIQSLQVVRESVIFLYFLIRFRPESIHGKISEAFNQVNYAADLAFYFFLGSPVPG